MEDLTSHQSEEHLGMTDSDGHLDIPEQYTPDSKFTCLVSEGMSLSRRRWEPGGEIQNSSVYHFAVSDGASASWKTKKQQRSIHGLRKTSP